MNAKVLPTTPALNQPPPVWDSMLSILLAVGAHGRTSPIGIAQNGPGSDILAVEFATRDEMLTWLPWFGIDPDHTSSVIPSGRWRGWCVQLSSADRFVPPPLPATRVPTVEEQADKALAELALIPVAVIDVPHSYTDGHVKVTWAEPTPETEAQIAAALAVPIELAGTPAQIAAKIGGER